MSATAQCPHLEFSATVNVARFEDNTLNGRVEYEAKSAGYGTHARWLHTCVDRTLARALRGLQDHYEWMAGTYASHANALQSARPKPGGTHG